MTMAATYGTFAGQVVHIDCSGLDDTGDCIAANGAPPLGLPVERALRMVAVR